MTEEEYFKWKKDYPDEWENVYDMTSIMYHEKYKYITPDYIIAVLNGKPITWAEIQEALTIKNDLCDDLVRMRKQSIDYKKKEHLSN